MSKSGIRFSWAGALIFIAVFWTLVCWGAAALVPDSWPAEMWDWVIEALNIGGKYR